MRRASKRLAAADTSAIVSARRLLTTAAALPQCQSPKRIRKPTKNKTQLSSRTRCKGSSSSLSRATTMATTRSPPKPPPGSSAPTSASLLARERPVLSKEPHLALGRGFIDTSGNQMELIKGASRVYNWHWNEAEKSHECLVSEDKLEVCFHPECSESTAAIRGSEPLTRDGNYYYWEVTALDKTYGTSVMFGLCTKRQLLHANDYCNLIGLDESGWSLSHKGFIWHNGKFAHFTQMFPQNQTVTIGLLFNTMRGELSYFMDGKNLGVAFCGLNETAEDLYPVIGSTAKCTRMRLTAAYRGYMSLLERSGFSLLKHSPDRVELIRNMYKQQVPRHLIKYLAEAAEVCASQTETITVQPDQCTWSVNQNQA